MKLQQGDSGDKVMSLQSALVGLNFSLPEFGVDGKYGPETASAVKEAQQKFGLSTTGVAGPELLTKLGLVKQQGPSQSSSSVGGGVIILGAVAVFGVGIAIKKAVGENQ